MSRLNYYIVEHRLLDFGADVFSWNLDSPYPWSSVLVNGYAAHTTIVALKPARFYEVSV